MDFITQPIINLLKNSFEIILKIILILGFAFLLNLLVKAHFRKLSNKAKKKSTVEERRLNKTRLEFLDVLISNLIFISAGIAILLLIPGFKTFSVSLLAGAGIAAIIIGFAAQKTIANIIAGISIIIYTPFRIGDKLKIGNEIGDVEDITLRHTVLRTWDNKRIFFPNSIIAEKEIINYSIKDEKVLHTIDMGIGYDSDIDKAKKIMIELAKKHPDVISPQLKDEDGNIETKVPTVRVTECGDFSVNLKLYFWVEKPGKAWTVAYDLIEQIKKEFDKKGIEIPYPYRTVVFKKDLEEKTKKQKKS